jgi:hypothetical protein
MSSAPTERKLAAILSADVVGYSRLMAEDEDETVRRLGAVRAASSLQPPRRRDSSDRITPYGRVEARRACG